AIVRGAEYRHRQRFVRDTREHIEARHPWHLDVEEHEIRLLPCDRLERLAAVAALGHDFDVAVLLKPNLNASSRELLIVHENRANGCFSVRSVHRQVTETDLEFVNNVG